ncbi:blocked early in transport 1 [Puccinia graminis f. sp. tritici CRL 75-36-700-3]|uniref:Blocked early in transport 1 n=1 Tax=Puccinia graminis f. sp. tritici (strain CRL 75-36-700-3 / race SCCL) TaxID=418459 RepID=E3K5L2_PUCGT|nr:blocked early in transport 1 [Puccinia graminis f. sp. tritici CRL 75-36-700-3]EFP79469.1 blocked early in transport 1 [Puccinia graminis f. sp. tritici CRL 75-36-700-3]
MSKLTHRDPNRAALLSRTPSYNSSPSSNPGATTIPNYGRSYGSYDQQLPFSSSSSSSFSNHRTAEELESQNDEAIEGLSAKVRLLKEITVNIGTEVKESSNLIATLNDKFSEATGVLSGTFKKMARMPKNQYGRWWYWFLFLIVVFWIFVFTWLWRR